MGAGRITGKKGFAKEEETSLGTAWTWGRQCTCLKCGGRTCYGERGQACDSGQKGRLGKVGGRPLLQAMALTQHQLPIPCEHLAQGHQISQPYK